MTDQIGPQVGGIQGDLASRIVQQNAQNLPSQVTETQVIEQSQAVRQVEAEESKQQEAKSEARPQAEPKPKTMLDVYLKFEVDEKNEITIYVLDKQSQKIIRSIPPMDITRMSAGELLELFI